MLIKQRYVKRKLLNKFLYGIKKFIFFNIYIRMLEKMIEIKIKVVKTKLKFNFWKIASVSKTIFSFLTKLDRFSGYRMASHIPSIAKIIDDEVNKDVRISF
ncbi:MULTISPECIES: hypothetical protein [unclassified Acinetobacter]|uniref:hypothetical protein n=1 Tax=unclassified Acinetobacter TaxID=196816 RepID=UPI003A8C39F5